MKLIPLSRASLTIRVVSSWPRLPMFILPPNCIVPRATSLTMSPVFPSFLYLIPHTPFRCIRKLTIPTVNSPQFLELICEALSPCSKQLGVVFPGSDRAAPFRCRECRRNFVCSFRFLGGRYHHFTGLNFWTLRPHSVSAT